MDAKLLGQAEKDLREVVPVSMPGQKHHITCDKPENLIHVVNYPFCIFVAVPQEGEASEFKKHLCSCLWQAGAEIPQASPDSSSILASNFLKIPGDVLKEGLERAGVGHCYIGKFGMKRYIPDGYAKLERMLSLADQYNALDIGIMCRDPCHIWLYGAKVNESGLYTSPDGTWISKVYPLFPLAQIDTQDFKEFWVFGTMEVKKLGGHTCRNEKGKQCQLYPLLTHPRKSLSTIQPVWPTTRGQMIDRKDGLLKLKDALVEQIPMKGGGGRMECRQRCHPGLAERLQDVWTNVEARDYVDGAIAAGHIKVLKLPTARAVALLQQAWQDTMSCFGGDRNAAPSEEERKKFLFLLAHLGFASGFWQRWVQKCMWQHLPGPEMGDPPRPRLQRPRQRAPGQPAEPPAVHPAPEHQPTIFQRWLAQAGNPAVPSEPIEA